MTEIEKALEAAFAEKRTNGAQVYFLRSQSPEQIRLSVEMQGQGVAMTISPENAFEFYRLNDPQKKRKWAEAMIQTIMNEFQRYIGS